MCHSIDIANGGHMRRTQWRIVSRLGALASAVLLVWPVSAQQSPRVDVDLPPDILFQIEALMDEKAERTPAQQKVSSELLELRVEPDGSVVRWSFSGERDLSELVTVDVRADVTPEVLGRIDEMGGSVVSSSPQYRAIRARIPLATVFALAELDEIQWIGPAEEPVTRRQASGEQDVLDPVGLRKVNTSEGDVAHQANLARQQHGVDGTGIGIGVISDGIRTLAARQSSGDLPHVTVLPGKQGPSNTDEGTAMLEIVHDLAPGATLYFATGTGGRDQFAENIESLCNAGADIIVDDVGYLKEAVFHDGIVAQGVNAAVSNGCIYFSAAGNDGRWSAGTSGVWEGDFAAGGHIYPDDISSLRRGGLVHSYDPFISTTRNVVTEYNFNTICLKWSEAYDEATSDYDLYLIHPLGFVRSSTDEQSVTKTPVECIGRLPNSFGSLADFSGSELLIVLTEGFGRYLHLNTHGGTLSFATEGATYGHSAAANTIGVTATDVTMANGAGGVFNGTESVEMFSSDGPRRIFFDPNKQAITPGNFSSTGGLVLRKPDVTAADRVSTATPTLETFPGTSAAAPHAAAIAALMLQAAGGPDSLTRAQLLQAMQSTAHDIGVNGWDGDSGAGIIDALAAVDRVSP